MTSTPPQATMEESGVQGSQQQDKSLHPQPQPQQQNMNADKAPVTPSGPNGPNGANDQDPDHDDNDAEQDASSVEDEDEVQQPDTLRQRRMKNIQRNRAFLADLNTRFDAAPASAHSNDGNSIPTAKRKIDDVAQSNVKKTRTDLNASASNQHHDDDQAQHQAQHGVQSSSELGQPGVTTESSAQRLRREIKRIRDRYPHRSFQIRTLASQFSSAVAAAQVTRNNFHSTTQHEQQKQQQENQLPQSHSAKRPRVFVPPPVFVIGPPCTGKTSLVRDVVASIQSASSHQNLAASSKDSTLGVGSAYVNCATVEPRGSDRVLKLIHRQLIDSCTALPELRQGRSEVRLAKSEPPAHAGPGNSEDPQSAQSTNRSNGDNGNSETDHGVVKDHKPSSQQSSVLRSTKQSLGGGSTGMNNRTSIHTHTRVADGGGRISTARCGRDLKPYFQQTCGFVILDNAERLLSLSTSRRSNLLAELLLLPKDAVLNLTIIVITRNCILDHSSLNNIVSGDKYGTTLNGASHPAKVYFSAYSESATFQQILSVPEVSRLVFGAVIPHKSDQQGLSQRSMMRSYLNILCQGLLGFTKNLSDFIYLGRKLWPVYNQSSDLQMKSSADPLDWNAKIRAVLDKRFLVTLQREIHPKKPKLEATRGTQAYEYVDHLQVAAYICQNNRPEDDAHFFSHNRSTQRRKSSSDIIGSTTTDDHEIGRKELKKLRPRPFSLERMLAVFVSLVRLHAACDDTTGDSLESPALYETLGTLRDLGVLQDASSGTLNMMQPKYWCMLSLEQAEMHAERAGIDLPKFLI